MKVSVNIESRVKSLSGIQVTSGLIKASEVDYLPGTEYEQSMLIEAWETIFSSSSCKII